MNEVVTKIDLTNCDREPIHIPGSIQPHGVMVAMEEPSLRITRTSANCEALLGLAAKEILGAALENILAPDSLKHLTTRVLPKPLEATPHYLPLVKTVAGRALEGVIHRYDGALILELEENLADEIETPRELYATLKATLAHLEGASSVREFCQSAAQQVRFFTGFDRVMIYRFAADDSGEVIAEAKREDLESFLGLHYPASDIPQQARALYLKSWLRFKVDNEATPVALVGETEKPLDLSYSVLRSMSPIHTEYLKNMGVQATMSISIIKDNKLWGLVACHHYVGPRYVAHEARMACEFLAHFLSLQLSAKEAAENHEYVSRLAARHHEFAAAMSQNGDFVETLMRAETRFLDWIEAGGVAFVVDDEIHLLGATPRIENVRSIVEWLNETVAEEVYATDDLPNISASAADCQETSAGVLALRLSLHLPHFILWFRPELIQTVPWGGDPTKPDETGEFGDRLTPRKSFELWTEEVKGKSAPWKVCEREAAANLRRSILEIVVRKAEALAKLNAELERSNIELDSFAYIASHDLKEPLRGIHNYSHFLLEGYADKLDMEGQEKLNTLMRLTQRMESLIESLLQYSRLGRAQIATREIDVHTLLRETLEMIGSRLVEGKTEVRIIGNLPKVQGDEVLLREVFTNLLTNALKYNDKPQRRVEIGVIDGENPAFFVRDNGIGIAEKHHEQIFRIFKRLHGREQFGGGVGAGLTITKKIIERHGGRIWLESQPQQGTTFYFTLDSAK